MMISKYVLIKTSSFLLLFKDGLFPRYFHIHSIEYPAEGIGEHDHKRPGLHIAPEHQGPQDEGDDHRHPEQRVPMALEIRILHIAVHEAGHGYGEQGREQRADLHPAQNEGDDDAGPGRRRHPLEIPVDGRDVHIEPSQPHGCPEGKEAGDDHPRHAQLLEGISIDQYGRRHPEGTHIAEGIHFHAERSADPQGPGGTAVTGIGQDGQDDENRCQVEAFLHGQINGNESQHLAQATDAVGDHAFVVHSALCLPMILMPPCTLSPLRTMISTERGTTSSVQDPNLIIP